MTIRFYISFQVVRISFFIVCNKVSFKREDRGIKYQAKHGRTEKIALTRQIRFFQILLSTILQRERDKREKRESKREKREIKVTAKRQIRKRKREKINPRYTLFPEKWKRELSSNEGSFWNTARIYVSFSFSCVFYACNTNFVSAVYTFNVQSRWYTPWWIR